MPNPSPRRRRTRQTDIGTTPIPYETLSEVAARWRAELRTPNQETADE